VREVRDDWELTRSVLFPSERGGPIGGDTFAAALGQAAGRHLRGPVAKLTPHVLRHARASQFGEGIEKRLPAGGRARRPAVQEGLRCNGTCGWPDPQDCRL
jgi:integrase